MRNKKMIAVAAYAGTSGRTDGRDSDSWFTPPEYVEAARLTLDGIDLDPFSSPEANETVKARRFYTVRDNAFGKQWRAKRVWMNPPYSKGLCPAAVDKLLEEFKSGRVENAIVLVNNATDTKWYSKLAKEAWSVCLTDHRIAFWNADGKKVSGNTRGQAFFLLTRDQETVRVFAEMFRKFGNVYGRTV